jgi:hypothetical protein
MLYDRLAQRCWFRGLLIEAHEPSSGNLALGSQDLSGSVQRRTIPLFCRGTIINQVLDGGDQQAVLLGKQL